MRYGDYDNVTKDSKAIYDIQSRQGSTILLECIAESIGDACIKFNLSDKEKKKLLNKTINNLKEEILERI